MSIVRRVAKNTAFLAGSEIVHKVLFFFLIIYATNVLGAVGFGRYSFAFAFGYLFTITCTLGIDLIIIKEVSRNKEHMNDYFNGLLSMRLLLSLLTYLIIIIITWILKYDAAYKAVILISCLSIIIDTLSTYIHNYFQAAERMEYVSISKIVQTLIIFVLGGIFLYLNLGLIWFVIAFLISSIITFVINLSFVIKKFVKFSIRIDVDLWKRILKASLPLALSALFGVLYFRIDTLMLSFLRNDVSVGIYNSAFQIIAALLFIPGVFMNSIFPLLSSQYKSMKDAFLRTLNLAMKVMVIIAVPVAFGIAVLSKRIITILYSPEYANAIIPLQILSFVMLIMFINYFFYSTINSINKHVIIAKIMSVCLIVNIILNYFLIIRLNTIGAALATLLANIFAFILYYLVVKIHVKGTKLIVPLLRPLISASLMVFIIMNYLWDLNMFLIVPIGALVYFAALLILRAFTAEEFKLVLEIFGLRKTS